MTDIRIQADSDDLEDLRRTLFEELGPDLELQEVSSIAPGELREPVLVSLVIVLGPVVVREFAAVVKRWMAHREKMKALELRMEILAEKPEPVSLDDLVARIGTNGA